MTKDEFTQDWIKHMGKYRALTTETVTEYLNKREAGHKLMPLEPTREILAAGHDWSGNPLAIGCYRNMLKAY